MVSVTRAEELGVKFTPVLRKKVLEVSFVPLSLVYDRTKKALTGGLTTTRIELTKPGYMAKKSVVDRGGVVKQWHL